MTTKSVREYQNIIGLWIRNTTYHFPLLKTPPLSIKPPKQANLSKLLLTGIEDALKIYLKDTTLEMHRSCFGKMRSHHPQATSMMTAIANYKERPEQQTTDKVVKSIIALMEKGILIQKCNLKGNFANLCRAIVNESRKLNVIGWTFSNELTDALGLARSTPRSSSQVLAW